MSKYLICPDVSEFQRSLDDSFNRDFVIFRVTFGAHYLDPRFLANAAAVKRLYQQNRISGVLLYTVFTADPVKEQFDAVWKAIGPSVPPWLTGIMIDVESWPGQSYALAGDHSKAINQLYAMHAHRMGAWSAVLAYGNVSDLAALFPGRDKRCRVIVAAYGSALVYKKVSGAIGQQYSDGRATWDVPKLDGKPLPRESSPFGHCDHNVFPDHPDGKALVQSLRPSQLNRTSVAKPPGGPRAYNVGRGNSLVSPSGEYALFLKNDGTVEVRDNHAHHTTLQEAN